MSAYCIKVSEHGDFLTSVFKQEQYMSIFLAAHVLLVSVLNPCFLLHAHFFCAPRKNIDWKTAFYSFCYFRMLLFIELLNPSLLCSTLRSAVTATLTLQISPHATGQCLFLYSYCLHWMYIDWKIRFYNTCCLLMLHHVRFPFPPRGQNRSDNPQLSPCVGSFFLLKNLHQSPNHMNHQKI